MDAKLKVKDLIYPYFVVEGREKKETIKHFPGVYRFSVDRLLGDIESTRGLGINKVLLFGLPSQKDAAGASAYAGENIVSRAVRTIKKEFKGTTVLTDVCLCGYTTHGHCGVLRPEVRPRPRTSRSDLDWRIDRKRTLEALAKMAVVHAEAGADWVAPSAMAKGQVLALRSALNRVGFRKTKILGYSAKFASNFYGPFRDAADSSPKSGDRSSYQLDFSDSRPALKEIEEDIAEGADMCMVKPALSYLDIISKAKEKFSFPLAAYNVSGEYSMVKYGAEQGLWDEKKMTLEILSSIKRAGADVIITYHAKDAARWLKKQN